MLLGVERNPHSETDPSLCCTEETLAWISKRSSNTCSVRKYIIYSISSLSLNLFWLMFASVWAWTGCLSLFILHVPLVISHQWFCTVAGQLWLYSCGVTQLSDWYTMMKNPKPNYTTTLHCTQEAVYPL